MGGALGYSVFTLRKDVNLVECGMGEAVSEMGMENIKDFFYI
jgi:hypothetical protein